MDKQSKKKYEVGTEVSGVLGINSFVRCNSASRKQMTGQHLGQALVIRDLEPKRIQTGIEENFGKLTHNIRIPCRAKVIGIVHKYPRDALSSTRHENPLTTIIFENEDDQGREVGMIDLPRVHSLHQHFGFRYSYRNVVNKITVGSTIPADTLLADSPSNDSIGGYKSGINANVAFMSTPSVIEDGVWMSESFAKRCTAKGIEVRSFSWGKKAIPLNLYGDDTRYKPFPDIGDFIREDGLVFATRDYDAYAAVVDMTPEALQEVMQFDTPVYINGAGRARVIDITVHRGTRTRGEVRASGMEDHVRKYYDQQMAYYRNIVAIYREIKRKRRQDIPKLSREFNRLVVEAHAHIDMLENNNVKPLYNYASINDWMVSVTLEYEIHPREGFKITGLNGDKGVNCRMTPDDWMPVDEMGVRADLVMDADSTIKRMNYGRLYEQYFNAAGYRIQQEIIKRDPRSAEEYQQSFDMLMDFYSIVAPTMHRMLQEEGIDTVRHVKAVIEDGVYLLIRPDEEVSFPEVVAELREKYPPHIGPVTYRSMRGELITTKKPILIGKIYVMLLEKTGKTWAAVASGRLQHYGIPARLTRSDRYSSPGREQPIRFGESELRLYSATCGYDAAAEIVDQTNNPTVHKRITESVLRAQTATDIHQVIDREKYPRGRGCINGLVNHVLACGGIGFVYSEDEE